MSATAKIFFSAFVLVNVLGAVLAGVTRDQMEKMAQGFRNSCVKKLGITDLDQVEAIRNGNFIEGEQKLKCYTKCVVTMMKTYKDGAIDLDALLKQIGIMASDDISDKLAAVAKECYNEVHDDDQCEYTWKFTKCSHDKDPSIFFFP